VDFGRKLIEIGAESDDETISRYFDLGNKTFLSNFTVII